MLPGGSPAHPGALLCNATRRLGDGQREILRQRVRRSVRAVRAVRNTRGSKAETTVVADVGEHLECADRQYYCPPAAPSKYAGHLRYQAVAKLNVSCAHL